MNLDSLKHEVFRLDGEELTKLGVTIVDGSIEEGGAFVVFRTHDGRYFKMTGQSDSYDYDRVWNNYLAEVFPEEVTVIKYLPKSRPS